MQRSRALGAVLAATLLLTACSSGADDTTDDATGPGATGPDATAAAGADGPLVVYTGRSTELVGPVLDDFSEQTGIEVQVRDGDTAEMALLIEQEGDATDADVFLAQSPGAVAWLSEAGLLQSVSDDLLAGLDDQYHADNGDWVGITARQRVLVYNQDLVSEDELPTSVFDLTDPEWAGRFAVAPTNGSFQDFVSALRQTEGDEAAAEWLAGIAANDVQTYGGNSPIVEAVGRGEVEMGLVNHYYNHRFLAEDPDLPSRNHRFPDGDIGSLLMLSTASIVAGTDQPEGAEQLIAFMLDTEAQEYFQAETFEYPLAGGVEPLDELPPLAGQDLPEVDYSTWGQDLDSTLEMITDASLASPE